jgi:hypothetical protein
MKYIIIAIITALLVCSCAKKENDLYCWTITTYQNGKEIDEIQRFNTKEEKAEGIITEKLKIIFMKGYSFTIMSTLGYSYGPLSPLITGDNEFPYSLKSVDGKDYGLGHHKEISSLSKEILDRCRNTTLSDIAARKNNKP